MFAGGFGDGKEADANVKLIAKGMKEATEKELGKTFKKFDAVLYATQVVNGTNYIIKVHIGHRRYIHIKVHVPLAFRNQPNELMEVQEEKTFYDPLVPPRKDE
jgi:hypothetical protein